MTFNRQTGIFLLLLLIFTASNRSVEAAIIFDEIDGNEANQATVTEGDTLQITGNGFGIRTNQSIVSFEIQGQKIHAGIITWTDHEIIVRVPLFPSIHKVKDGEKIELVVSDGKTAATKKTTFQVFNQKPILYLIELKKAGFSDDFILNQFDKITAEEGEASDHGLNGAELVRLKAAGFNDAIIASFAKHRQLVTIGLAGIWLSDTRELVPSPLLRIFLSPRSFFHKRSPIWRDWLPAGLFDMARYDLNIGFTGEASTDNDSEEKSYLLVGFSFEINRAALFNFGYALVPGDVEGEQTQPYFGITVDSNILKDLGILNKG